MIWFVMFVWLWCVVASLFHFSGWVTGTTYDFVRQERTYHGTKFLGYVTVLVIMYYLLWHRWGVF